MTRLTDEECAELKRMESEATPGPWKSLAEGGPHKGSIRVEERSESGIETVAHVYCGAYEGHGAANADLIAAARNALLRLLAEREEMRRELEELVLILDGYAQAGPVLPSQLVSILEMARTKMRKALEGKAGTP